MGGMETKTITLRNLDVFSYIGLFSGGSIGPDEIIDMDAFKKSNQLVFVSYGSGEVDGSSPPWSGPKGNDLGAQGSWDQRHYYISQGTAHEWQSWRRSLKEIAPLLFKK